MHRHQAAAPRGYVKLHIDADSGARGWVLADRIYRMNPQTVTSAERLRELLRGMKRGDPTAFQLARNGRLRFVVAEILGPAGNVAPPAVTATAPPTEPLSNVTDRNVQQISSCAG